MKKFDSINIMPFIDIILVLLAIVLVSASFVKQGKISVSIPSSQSKDIIVADDMVNVITITKDGSYFYNDKLISSSDIKTKLATLNSNTKITLKVDAKTYFQDFVSISDLLKEAHISKVSVVTQRKEHDKK